MYNMTVWEHLLSVNESWLISMLLLHAVADWTHCAASDTV